MVSADYPEAAKSENRATCVEPGVPGGYAQPEMGQRYYLARHAGRLAVPGFHRRIVGWAMEATMDVSLVEKAWQIALLNRHTLAATLASLRTEAASTLVTPTGTY